MKETFDLITSILNAGKSLVDNLFSKKLTKEDVEALLAKYHVNQTRAIEKFFVVINENQELIYNEKGELFIKNVQTTDKQKLQELFMKMLLQHLESDNEVKWQDAEISEPTGQTGTTSHATSSEYEMILQIKEKHNVLYGE